MSSRRKPPEVSGGGGSWMDTYGDMVTLLLTFFVLLYSFSTIDIGKWKSLVNSFRGERIVAIAALDPDMAQIGEDLPTPRPTPPGQERPDGEEIREQFDELYQRIRQHIGANNLEAQLSVRKTQDIILLRVTESALFDSGQDRIRPDAQQLLNMVMNIFEEYQASIENIRIEGHTDNVPISNAKFDSNWELSACRASKVVQYFLQNSVIEPERFTVSGNAEYHPIASNDTEEGKALNRRVDFVIQGITSDN